MLYQIVNSAIEQCDPESDSHARLQYAHQAVELFLDSDEGDQILLAMVQSGNEDLFERGFDRLFSKYHSQLIRVVSTKFRRYSMFQEDFEDIASKTWLIALKKLITFKWKNKPIKRYLFKIAENVGFELHRERYAQYELPQLNIAFDFLDEMLADVDEENRIAFAQLPGIVRELVVAAKKQLTGRRKEVIELAFYGEVNKSPQIAQLLGLEASNVRQIKRRALKQMKEYIESRFERGGENNEH